MDDEALEFFNALAADAGTPVLTAAEIDEVLKLTKVVAHRSERRFAPLTAYAAGLLLSAEIDAEARAQRVQALTEQIAARRR